MEMKLFDRETIAGAVAREIQRREFAPTKQIEGLAYKAAFDRMGSAAEKHIDAFAADAKIMNMAGDFVMCGKCGTRATIRELLQFEACPVCKLVL